MAQPKHLFRFGITAKILLILGIFVASLISVSVLILRDARQEYTDAHTQELQRLVETVASHVAIYAQEAADGKVTLEQAQHEALEELGKMRYGHNEYFWVNDMTPRMLLHPFKPELNGQDMSAIKDPDGKALFVEMVNVVKRDGQGMVGYMWPKPGAEKPQPKISYVYGFKPWGWVIGSGVYVDDIDAEVRAKAWKLAKISGFILLLLFAVTLPMTLRLTRAIRGITTAMKTIADGNLTAPIPYTDRNDEVGDMAAALKVFKDNAEIVQEMQQEQTEKARQAATARKRDMMKLADDFEAAVSVVASAVSKTSAEMSRYARDLTDASKKTTEKAGAVAKASEEASGNVATVASATEELVASIGEITRQVSDSSTTAAAAVTEARTTNATMATMAEAAQKIGTVVQLINEIATQTNLLALNATIEAARAGDAGKGFAVVANEVKNLATQTAKATDEITQQIDGIRTVADSAVEAIRHIGGTIEKVSSITTAIAAAVEEQGSATSEISRNVQGASQGTRSVSSAIEEVNAVANHSNTVATRVADAAAQLSQQSDRLQKELQTFIATVRAA